MGKWTASYYDDILASKIKGLVAGVIKRIKLEKTEPTITYEAFVEELDGGDSFTTSLIDILVKELAERRMRPTSADRRLIADSSAKSLRMLATPLRVYRDRSGSRGSQARRSVNLTNYLTAPPEEMDMDEDDDEFESMLGNATSTTEGARVGSEMYDAYSGNSQRWSRPSGPTVFRRSYPSYSAAVAPAGSDDAHSTHDLLSRSHSPPILNRSGPWALPSSNTTGSSLFRQPSIRRPARSRTVDFNEFTSHRRSTTRQNAAQESLASRSETVDNGTPPPELLEEPTQLARRFFPFSRNRRQDFSGSTVWAADTSSAEAADEPSSYMVVEPWFSLPTPISSSSSSSQPDAPDSETSDQHVQPVALRLRRGGVRAPESMLSRHASPSLGEHDAVSPPIVRVPPVPSSDDRHVEDATAYPSPSQHESNTDS